MAQALDPQPQSALYLSNTISTSPSPTGLPKMRVTAIRGRLLWGRVDELTGAPPTSIDPPFCVHFACSAGASHGRVGHPPAKLTSPVHSRTSQLAGAANCASTQLRSRPKKSQRPSLPWGRRASSGGGIVLSPGHSFRDSWARMEPSSLRADPRTGNNLRDLGNELGRDQIPFRMIFFRLPPEVYGF